MDVATEKPAAEAVPAPAAVEVSAEEKQRVETDTYLAERAKAKAAELIAQPVETPKEEKPAELTDQQAVDAYIEERNKGQRKTRGGRRAQFDQWTKERTVKEAAQADEIKQLKSKVEELATKAAAPAPTEPKKEEVKPAEPIKEAPKMSDYTDIDKYYADVALWASQTAKPAAVATIEPPKPAAVATSEPVNPVRKEEFDRFLEVGREYVKRNPSFNEDLQAAHVRGLTMGEPARIAITRLAAPQVAHWLSKPENDGAARKLMQMDDFQQVIEVGKIAERLAVKPGDFVSNAPAPGMRLNGNTAGVTPTLQDLAHEDNADEYIRQRRMQKRAGRR